MTFSIAVDITPMSTWGHARANPPRKHFGGRHAFVFLFGSGFYAAVTGIAMVGSIIMLLSNTE
jgi:hypothetical protein